MARWQVATLHRRGKGNRLGGSELHGPSNEGQQPALMAARSIDHSGHAHFEPPAGHARCGFNLVEPRGVSQVEQPVNRAPKPAQAPRQSGLLDACSVMAWRTPCFAPSKADRRTVRCPRLALLATGIGLRAPRATTAPFPGHQQLATAPRPLPPGRSAPRAPQATSPARCRRPASGSRNRQETASNLSGAAT